MFALHYVPGIMWPNWTHSISSSVLKCTHSSRGIRIKLNQSNKPMWNLSPHRCRRHPWSRTCHSRSGKADLVVASELTGWKTTTPARRYWPSGTGSPRWLLLSALSLSLSGRWPATAGRHRLHYSFALSISFLFLFSNYWILGKHFKWQEWEQIHKMKYQQRKDTINGYNSWFKSID